jgi:hypothetical protein
MIKKVAIDLDGVLAAFTEHAAKRHDITLPPGPIEEDFLYKKLNHNKRAFWKKCHGLDFWTSMPTFPWAHDLVNLVNNSGLPWIFLTKVPLDDEGFTGKAKWVTKHFPKYTDRLWPVRGDKHFVAMPGFLLIDDKWKNIDPWNKASGVGFYWQEIQSNMTVEANVYLHEIDYIIKNYGTGN